MNGYWKAAVAIIVPVLIAVIGYGASRDNKLTEVCADTRHIGNTVTELKEDVGSNKQEIDAIKQSMFRTEFIVIQLGKQQGVEIPGED